MSKKSLYILHDDSQGISETLLLSEEQAAMFYYIKETIDLYDCELKPMDSDTPKTISFEDYHYE